MRFGGQQPLGDREEMARKGTAPSTNSVAPLPYYSAYMFGPFSRKYHLTEGDAEDESKLRTKINVVDQLPLHIENPP